MGRKIGGLGLVNYKEHPTNNRYIVFSLIVKAEADFFEESLKEQNINYEKDVEELESLSSFYFTIIPQTKLDRKGKMYLFAVEKKHSEKVHQINYNTTAKFREFTIKNSFFRWALVIFFLSVVAFAVVGYLKS